MSAPVDSTAYARPESGAAKRVASSVPDGDGEAAGSTETLWVARLGLIAYRDAFELQQRLQARRQADEIPDTLLLLEHPPVYTRGRRSTEEELTLGEDFYTERGIEIVSSDRGGRITYHGPGQLVGYPIMRLKDVISHLRSMEGAIIAALADEGIGARSRCGEGPDWTGVWVADRKIASLGVHVSRGVSTHGFAVNVTNDLGPFSWIVPCGLTGVRMTSIAAELGARAAGSGDRAGERFAAGADLDRFADRVTARFCEIHGQRAVDIAPERLHAAATRDALAGAAR